MWDLKSYANNTALVDEDGQSLTYSELDEASQAIAQVIGRRCLVFIMCSNCIGSTVGYVGCLNNGIVPLLLSSGLDEKLLNSLMKAYRPGYLWMPVDQARYFAGGEVAYRAYGYALVRIDSNKDYALHEDLALLLTTSGSTGSPKLVRQSYENVLNNAQSISNYLELNEAERPITVLPMSYTYGLSVINSHLLVGATLLLTDKSVVQREFWSFFKSAEATSLSGVPYTYEMLDRIRFMRMDLPSLKTMTQAGGKLAPALHEKYARFAHEKGKRFVVMYGQCEATARMGYLPADMAIKKKGSMGIAIPGGAFHLVDAEGIEVTEPFTMGELVYEGKNVTLGYAECGADLARGDERNGVLYTGDMAQFDEDGYYYIVGRKKRFLKLYGNRVNLDEVDRLIKSEFGIEVVCAGMDDHLCVFLTESERADSILEFVSMTTKINPLAFSAVVVPEIPKNEAGKVLYKELEKHYQ